MSRRRIIIIVTALVAVVAVTWVAVALSVKVTITPIGRNVYFTTKYNSKAKTCVPAAYTSYRNTVLGQHRINGKTYGNKSFPWMVSLTKSGMKVSRKWHSKSGFQQHILVRNGRANMFRRDQNRRFRRALCNRASDKGEYLIVESTYPMTMTEFAAACAKHCHFAVNLDMGHYSYGRVNGRVSSWWTIFWRSRQTNWICAE